jgi:hypothetical protein
MELAAEAFEDLGDDPDQQAGVAGRRHRGQIEQGVPEGDVMRLRGEWEAVAACWYRKAPEPGERAPLVAEDVTGQPQRAQPAACSVPIKSVMAPTRS